jgi:glycosyltransferase involved in cell wall biosynthesis
MVASDKSTSKRIIVLYANSFPIGGAATNRVTHLCKILKQEGNSIRLYITRPTEKPDNLKTARKGVFEGIEFCYVNKNIIWPEKLARKIQSQLIGLIKTALILIRGDFDLVLSYADYSLIHHFIYFIVSKIRRKKIVYAIDEFPWSVIYHTSSVFDKIFLKVFYKLFDGLIVMTFTLAEYYSGKVRKDAIIHQLPMTVDMDRFNVQLTHKIKGPSYIAYCGYDISTKNGLIVSKDGVDILIEAFSIIIPKHPDIFLYIIGEYNKYRVQQVEKLHLSGRVVFIGNVHRDNIPEYLFNAKLLVLARPNNKQAQGAFPSKLGEYLATANPVVATKVGEIPLYLKDNWNAFLAEPGNVQSFAEKMDYVLSNPGIAKKIGTRGRELAENEFDYKKQGIKLQEFLTKL